MVTSLFVRHFKVYKGISFIPLSEGCGFSSIIGENGVGKSSVLEALDFVFNKKNFDWPINSEAKSAGGITGNNVPFIAPVFLIRKENLRKELKADQELYDKAEQLSNFLWKTKLPATATSKPFKEHVEKLKANYKEDDYFLIIIGKRYNEPGIYFGSFHNSIIDAFVEDSKQADDKKNEDALQKLFKGFSDYLLSHYSYLYIPVETDVHTYTKLETEDMKKLMDKDIRSEIENAIGKDTIKLINKNLNHFVEGIESVLEIYEYKGHHKNSLTMSDLVSKIIEAYFSIKVLNRKSEAKSIPVSELSSGEKRKALIDVAYSFLLKNHDRDTYIILAIDEPEASLHISSCYSQFEKLIKLGRENHQVMITTHWYGFLPVVTQGSATSLRKKGISEVEVDFYDLYNYREKIVHAQKQIKGRLPIDYNIKSYNDLVQSILLSLMSDEPYNWIICEGLSEKIYFEEMFKDEIENHNLRLLPLGGFKEVKKLYNNLITPIKDPDYKINGKVFCIVDTDTEKLSVSLESSNHLTFERLMNFKGEGTKLLRVDHGTISPPTEIEDCLDSQIFYQTLLEFIDENDQLKGVLATSPYNETAESSASTFDLRDSEKQIIKDFFDGREGYNKIRFAKKYVEIVNKPFFWEKQHPDWIINLQSRIKFN